MWTHNSTAWHLKHTPRSTSTREPCKERGKKAITTTDCCTRNQKPLEKKHEHAQAHTCHQSLSLCTSNWSMDSPCVCKPEQTQQIKHENSLKLQQPANLKPGQAPCPPTEPILNCINLVAPPCQNLSCFFPACTHRRIMLAAPPCIKIAKNDDHTHT